MTDEPKGLTLHHVFYGWCIVILICYFLYSVKQDLEPVSEHVAELRWEELR